jgi:hypothetical protein
MDLNGKEVDPAAIDEYLKGPRTGAAVCSAGVLAAVVLYCTGQALTKCYGPALFCSPLFVGAIVGVLSFRRPVRNAIYTVLVALLIAIISFKEGIVCSLFSLPLVMPEAIVGALCGSTIRRYVRDRRARAAVLGTLLLFGVAWQAVEGAVDDPSRHPVHVARSAIVIPAAPDRVFAAIATRELEVQSDWPWFLRIGLPMPIRMTIDPSGPDGRVTATFSQGRAYGHITSWQPGRELAYTIDRYAIDDLPFHITRLGRSPTYGMRAERMEDWLTLLSTRYQLVPLPSGATELRREVVWRRHLAPAFYFAWLQQVVIQRGQDRLLELIRRRVGEAAQPSSGGPGPVSCVSPDRPGYRPGPACHAFLRGKGVIHVVGMPMICKGGTSRWQPPG